MTQLTSGRHRRPGRLSAANTTLTRSAAVAAASTGLLAGTALSASAAPDFVQDNQSSHSKGVEALVRLGLTVQEDRTVVAERSAEAAQAPEDSSPVNFGTSGFSGDTPVVEAVAPEPVVTQTQAPAAVDSRTETSASRTNERTEPAQLQQTQLAAPAAAPEAAPVAAPELAPPATPEPAPAPAPPAAGGLLGIAASLVGTPYVWGGSTPAGFDCSGYTSYVFAQVGISLPRTAAMQQAAATPVSNPQAGDLVFYGYPAYHVGIYAGDGMMYDSSRPGVPTQYRAVFPGVAGYGRVG